MDAKTFRWLYREIDGTVMFWFTTWLFWIDKPVWKWVFLGLTVINAFAINQMNRKMKLEEFND